MSLTHLVLIRGAETDLHCEGKIVGQLNPEPLVTDVPLALITAFINLARQYGPFKSSELYSSNLKRACGLVDELVIRLQARASEGIFPNAIPYDEKGILRERHFGKYQGTFYDDLPCPSNGRDDFLHTVKDESIEPPDRVKLRAEFFRDSYIAETNKELVIALTHFHMMHYILESLGCPQKKRGMLTPRKHLQGFYVQLEDMKPKSVVPFPLQ